jgi:hypothetical protein
MCPFGAVEQPTRQSHGQYERRTQYGRGSSHHSVPRFTEQPAMTVTSAERGGVSKLHFGFLRRGSSAATHRA